MDDYRAEIAGLGFTGGAVIAGSFQGYDQTWLLAALAALGPGYAGVAQLPPTVPDDEIHALHAAGVRAVRFNLRRGGALAVDLALRVYDVAGWHTEVYATDLPEHETGLRELPRLCVDHLGMNADGLAVAARLGAMVKATPRHAADLAGLDPGKVLFGTDLPGTRSPRRFQPVDLETAPLAADARAWYRVPA